MSLADAVPRTSGLIQLDHGAGGGMSQELILGTIIRILDDTYLGEMEDSAALSLPSAHIALTTDSFVVDPIFFGNGNVGKIAVAGTVNDLAVSGATPLYLTLAMIIEEGFPLEQFEAILISVRDTAREAGVKIVGGDTKVVRRGEADQIFINTAGVGVFDRRGPLSPRSIRSGDLVVVTGLLGDHSIHLLSMREGLGFENRVISDCAVLNHVIDNLLTRAAGSVRCLRDITRGGLGTVLNEFATASGHDIAIEELALPIRHETAMAADMLGVDVMYLANEGNLCLVIAPEAIDQVLGVLRSYPETAHAALVGSVTGTGGSVELIGQDGGRGSIDLLYGAQLPRLC